MSILNRYALKKDYYLLKLVGLVLSLNMVLILGLSREHWAQTLIENVTIITINTINGPKIAEIEKDTIHVGGNKYLAPNVNGSGGPSPSNNEVVINGTVNNSVAGIIAGGLSFSGANLENNTVNLIDAANISGSVYGGYGKGTSNIINNTVNLTDAAIISGSVFGSYIQNGSSSGNSVIFSRNSTAKGSVYGSYILDFGNSDDNSVTFNNSIVSSVVYGSYLSEDGNSNDNSVIFQNSTASSLVYGSYLLKYGNSNDNSVIFNNSTASSLVYGSYLFSSIDGNSNGNNVIFSGYSTASSPVWGSYISGVGNSNGNSVTFNNSTASSFVYGSYITSSGNSSGNNVILNTSKALSVYGSYIISGNSTDNNVILNSSNATSVYGSFMTQIGNSTRNNVILNNSNANFVYGGYGDTQSSAVVTDNIVDVFGGKIINVTGGSVGNSAYSSSHPSEVRGNKVRLVGTDAENIFGGFAVDKSLADVSSNMVEVTGGNVTGNITGGRASIGKAFNNTVVINDTIKNIKSVIGGYSNSSSADNNTVILKNVIVSDDVYGGYSNTSTGGYLTSNNAVTLAGIEIGKNLIGGNQNGTNNNIIFDRGPRNNLVKGSVNASGELLIVDGSNAVTQSTNVGRLNITGGQTNTFNSEVNVTGDISITGGQTNTFNSDVNVDGDISINGGGKNIFLAGLYSESGDMVIARGVNTFHDLMTNTSNTITVTGPANYYKGDITTQKLSLNGGNHYFASTQSINTTDDVVASNSWVEFEAGANLTLNKSLRIARNSVLKLGASASLKTTGSLGFVSFSIFSTINSVGHFPSNKISSVHTVKDNYN